MGKLEENIDPRVRFPKSKFGPLGPLRILAATYFGLCCLPYCLVWPFIIVLVAPIKGLGHRFVHWVVKIFLECWSVIFGIKIIVDGAEHIDPDQTYVVAGNHRSWLDAVTLIVAFKDGERGVPRRNLYFIIKRSLLFIPFFGIYMYWAGYVPVVRDLSGRPSRTKGASKKSGKAAGQDNSARVQAAVEHLARGKSILIFPEGTRSSDHRFKTFKKGAAQMAIKAEVPILPVVFSGAGKLYPKGKIFIRPGTVRLEFLPPISPAGHTRESLTQTLYDAMTDRYRPEWDGPPLEANPELLALIAPQHSGVGGKLSGQRRPDATVGYMSS